MAADLINRGTELFRNGDLEGAEELFVEAAAAASSVRDELQEGRALSNLGALEARRGQYAGALQFLGRALERFRSKGDEMRSGRALFEAALCFEHLGDREAAGRVMRQAAGCGDPGTSAEAASWLASTLGRGSKHEIGEAPRLDAGFLSHETMTPRVEESQMRGTSIRSSPGRRRRREVVAPQSLPFQAFGFENVGFSDVLARAGAGLSALDATARVIRAQAAAEERYAAELRRVGDARHGTGAGDSGGLLGAALGAAESGLAFWGSSKRSAGAAAAVRAGEARSDRGTLFAALDAMVDAAKRDAARRQSLSMQLSGLVDELCASRTAFERQLAGLAEAADGVVEAARSAANKVGDAQRALEEKRSLEAKATAALRAAELALLQDPESSSLEQAATKARARVEAAALAVAGAEENLRAAATKHVLARKARAETLAAAARGVQSVEEERLEAQARAVAAAADAKRAALDENQASHSRCATVVGTMDPGSDMRMFLHKQRVRQMVRDQLADLRQRQITAEARRRRREQQPSPVLAPMPAPKLSDDDAALLGETVDERRQTESAAADAQARRSKGPEDEGFNVVPQTASAAVRKQYSAAHLRAEKTLGPPVAEWAALLLKDRGTEFVRRQNQSIYSVPPLETSPPPTPPTPPQPPQAEPLLDDDIDDVDMSTAPDRDIAKPTPIEAPDKDEVEEIRAPDPNCVDAGYVFSFAAGRAAFLRMLNGWRGSRRHLSSQRAFRRLGRVLWWLLDACRTDEDVAAAKIVMIMAQTFFVDEDAPETITSTPEDATTTPDRRRSSDSSPEIRGTGKRRYVQDLISSHPLWQHLGFWEAAFYHSVREEVARLYNPRQAQAAAIGSVGLPTRVESDTSDTSTKDEAPPPSPSPQPQGPPPTTSSSQSLPTTIDTADEADEGIVDVPAATVLPGSSAWYHVYRNALFGQLASYAMNLREFGVPEAAVVRIVTRLAHGNGVPNESLDILLREARGYDAESIAPEPDVLSPQRPIKDDDTAAPPSENRRQKRREKRKKKEESEPEETTTK